MIMTGLIGNLNGSLGVVSKLLDEGHKVTCMSVLEIREKVERHGMTYVQLPPINFSFSHEDFGLPVRGGWLERFKNNVKNRVKIRKKGRKILGLDRYEKIIADLNLDRVVIGQELHDLIFVCYRLKIPITLLSTWFSNRMGMGTQLPPLRTDIIPGNGLKGSKLGILTNWIFIKLKVQARILIDKVNFKGYRRAALKKYALASGFPFKTVVSSNLPQLFSYTNLPTISLTMAEMDFPHIPYTNFKYIGPMVYWKRDAKAKQGRNTHVEVIIKQKQATGKKLIYCSYGSLLAPDVSFLNNVIKAIEKQDDWLLIASLGGNLAPDTFKTKSENVFIHSWVPQLRVLEHADCFITHAGINSINESIHFTVPILAYSGKKFDQNGCAARVHYNGMGIMGDKDKDNYLVIRHNIKKILEEPSFVDKINHFNGLYNRYKKKKLMPFLA